jgi:voltage-gated potassium channel Kch
MANFLFIPYNQAPGVGQGYYVAQDPLGTRGVVTVASTAGAVHLVITRYNAPIFETTIPAGSTFAVSIGHVQTIGLLALGAAATGTLSYSFEDQF